MGVKCFSNWASLVAQLVKNPPAMWEAWIWSLGGEDPLENGTATHSSILAWRIPWTEEPGKLQSLGSLRVGHDWATSCIGEGTGNLLQCSCLENTRDGGAWWTAVYGVTQSQTRLKWLSSSSKTCLNNSSFESMSQPSILPINLLET